MPVAANEGRKVEKCPVPGGRVGGAAREERLSYGPHLWIIARPGPATADAEETAQDSDHVGVQYSFPLRKGLRTNSAGNIAPDAGQRQKGLLARRHGPAVIPYQGRGNAPQTICPVIQPQRRKQPREALDASRSQTIRSREIPHHPQIYRHHFGRVRLLKKNFRQEDMVRVGCFAPGELAGVLAEPGRQPTPKVCCVFSADRGCGRTHLRSQAHAGRHGRQRGRGAEARRWRRAAAGA